MTEGSFNYFIHPCVHICEHSNTSGSLLPKSWKRVIKFSKTWLPGFFKLKECDRNGLDCVAEIIVLPLHLTKMFAEFTDIEVSKIYFGVRASKLTKNWTILWQKRRFVIDTSNIAFLFETMAVSGIPWHLIKVKVEMENWSLEFLSYRVPQRK